MSLPELLEFLQRTRSAHFERAGEVSDLYRSLSESMRTLAVPFRNSLASPGSFEASLERESRKLASSAPRGEGRPGSVEHNTARLVHLLNQVYAIRNAVIPELAGLDNETLLGVREIHGEILGFLEELYRQNTGWILQDPGAEASIMARQKRRDIEELLKDEIDPYFERLLALRSDECTVRLNLEMRQDSFGLQEPGGSPQALEAQLREKCTLLGIAFDAGRTEEVLRDLREDKGELERRIRQRYEPRPEAGELSAAILRRRYLGVLQRYLARVGDVSALLTIVEDVYALYQPRPSFVERLRVFIGRLFGRDERLPRRDIDYSYVVGKQQIERRRASLEELIRGVNNLEKMLLRIKNHINEYTIHKRLAEFPVPRARELVERTGAAMRRVFDDSFGLVQWLGKEENRDKLALLPQASQRDFNAHLDSIYATLIINAERLRDIDHDPGEQGPEQGREQAGGGLD